MPPRVWLLAVRLRHTACPGVGPRLPGEHTNGEDEGASFIRRIGQPARSALAAAEPGRDGVALSRLRHQTGSNVMTGWPGMSEDGSVIGQIYEAAFIPELWPSVLGTIAERCKAVSGELQVVVDGQAPRWTATEVTRDALDAFMQSGLWRSCERPSQYLEAKHAGFLCDVDIMTPEQILRDPVRHLFDTLGLGWQLGTVIPMSTGEMVGLTFERPLELGKPSRSDCAALDAMRPHLALSTRVAARLRLERAETATATLNAIGLPAAVIAGSGHVLTGNRFFDAMGHLFLTRAFGRLAIADSGADRLFQDAMVTTRGGGWPPIRSVPVKPTVDREAAIIHLLPLRRAACDIFGRADVLLIASEARPEASVPAPAILCALFDLTPSEARLAAGLAAGRSLKLVAAEMDIALSSARTYLGRIFDKTATNQQSELVALLKSIQPVEPGIPRASLPSRNLRRI